MVYAMEQLLEEKWDQRNWELSLKADNPVETYMKSVEERRLSKDAVSIDDLSKEEQAWYRA